MMPSFRSGGKSSWIFASHKQSAEVFVVEREKCGEHGFIEPVAPSGSVEMGVNGEILTDFLNYDPTSFLEAVEEMKRFMEEDDSEKYFEAELRTEELLLQMPLYRDFAPRREQLAFRRCKYRSESRTCTEK